MREKQNDGEKIRSRLAGEMYLVDLPPFLCGLLGETLVYHGHDFVEQMTVEQRSTVTDPP